MRCLWTHTPDDLLESAKQYKRLTTKFENEEDYAPYLNLPTGYNIKEGKFDECFKFV